MRTPTAKDRWRQVASHRDDTVRRLRQVTDRLGRIKGLYGWGDLTRVAYPAERDHPRAKLAPLRESTDHAAVLAHTAAYPCDPPVAWTAAAPAERNDLTRAVFQRVEITDDRVTAVLRTADFAPFFDLVVANTETGLTALAAPDCPLDILRGGSDGGRPRR